MQALCSLSLNAICSYSTGQNKALVQAEIPKDGEKDFGYRQNLRRTFDFFPFASYHKFNFAVAWEREGQPLSYMQGSLRNRAATVAFYETSFILLGGQL